MNHTADFSVGRHVLRAVVNDVLSVCPGIRLQFPVIDMRNFFVTLVFALLSSLLLAETTPARPTVIALPLQAGPGLKADEVDLGYAVQNVIENVLLVHGGLDYQPIVGQQRSLFASADDLAAWVHGQRGAKETTLDASSQNVVLHGRVSRNEETLLAEVELWDRRNDKRVKRDLAIDLPGLVSFRTGLIGILTEAGLAPGSKQKESMLWKEDISLPAFRLLAEGVGGDLLAGYGGKPQSVTPLEAAVKQSAQSYLAQNCLGWLHHRNQQYDSAKDRFTEATRINTSAIDALDGIIDSALRGKDITSAELYARRKAEIRGEPPAWQLADIYQRAAAKAADTEHLNDAIDYYELALKHHREVKDSRGEALSLNNAGAAYDSLNRYDQAIAYYEHALAAYEDTKDKTGEATARGNLCSVHNRLHDYIKAIGCYEKLLQLVLEFKDGAREAGILSSIGAAYCELGQYDKAFGYYERAVAIQREVKDRFGEAKTLNDLGVANRRLSKYDRAIGYYEQALSITREIKELTGEADTLDNLGVAYDDLRQYERAITYYELALAIRREIKDRAGEADTLNNLGVAYEKLSEYEKAIGYYEQALPIRREVKDRAGEAITLSRLGMAYHGLSQYGEAISYYELALPIRRGIKDRAGEAASLTNLGVAYEKLSQYEKAIGYYEQALPITRELTNRAGEAATLSNLGVTHSRLSQYEKAISYYDLALPIRREIKDRAGEAATLSSLGGTYAALGQHEKAMGYQEQALALMREAKDRSGEAASLQNLGSAYQDLSQYEKAIGYYEQALSIRREIKDRDGEAASLWSLMLLESILRQSRLAIFYGKQSVNVCQSIRNDIRGLSKEIQKGYLESHAETYRKLAELLASEGRIAEAEQVLRSLKDEEYSEFVRDAAAKSTETLSLNSHEKAVQAKYDELSKSVTAIGERLAVLSKKGEAGRTTEESAEWKQLSQKREEATARFNDFLKGLHKEFAGQETEAVRMNEIASGRSMMRTLSDMGPGTVAVYTLTAKDRYIAFLFTPNAQISKEYTISSAELGTKIWNFRNAVLSKRDPLALAQELYRIIIRPMEKDLEGAGAKTIMWSLDGSLRYLPIAALHDGHQYMLERYQNVVFQPNRPLHATPSAKWDALALGVSKPHETENWHFPPLTNVPAELRAIIKNDENHAGALPGTEKLDEQFTWDAMVDELGRRSPTVVHIASHFEFAAGDDAASVLLLGDGTTLSLKKLKSQTNLFNNVDLLTLSACNTALTGGGQESGDGKQNGQEVDGLAITAQDQGAASVLATLWQVFDPSTSALMSKFYALHESSPTMTKAEALREAQLALLHGSNAAAPSSDKPVKRSGNQTESSPERDNRSARLTGAPTETRSPGRPNDYSHPYYWAPFILMGNWK